MKVERTASASFRVEFESEQELRDEHRANFSFGALRLPTAEKATLHEALAVTLRGPSGAEVAIRATVVAALPDGIACSFGENADELLERLLKKDEQQSPWDRIRSLTQTEKIILAVKADRPDRALLLQDNDPRVLLSVLRNPRITIEEVVRVAKSTYLNHQIADVIVKTGQWMSSIEVRTALVHNAKTPQAFALRILPSLPDAEVRQIAKGGTNMALKQAAVRMLQGR